MRLKLETQRVQKGILMIRDTFWAHRRLRPVPRERFEKGIYTIFLR